MPAQLALLLRDGRAVVRANAVLGLAAAGHAVLDMVTLLRDSDPRVALAAAEAIARLGLAVRPLLPQIAQALDGAQPGTVDAVVAAFAELIARGDAEAGEQLAAALDVPLALAKKGVVEAAGKLGRPGIAFLIRAAAHERSRVRINAIGGLARFGKVDPDTSHRAPDAGRGGRLGARRADGRQAGDARDRRAREGGRGRRAAQEHPGLRGAQAVGLGAVRVRGRDQPSTR